MSTQQANKLQANKSAQTPKAAESTPATQADVTTTSVETAQGTPIQQEQPTASEVPAVHVEEKEEQVAHNYVMFAAAMLGISVTDLETLTQYCFINKDKLFKKVKEKGLAKAWEHVQKKSGVTIEAGKISQLIEMGVTHITAQVISQVKAESEELGNMLESNYNEMLGAYNKSFAKTKNRTIALRKAILKLDFMGLTGDVIIVHPYAIKALELVDTHLPSPNPTVGEPWRPGSFSRAINRVFSKAKK